MNTLTREEQDDIVSGCPNNMCPYGGGFGHLRWDPKATRTGTMLRVSCDCGVAGPCSHVGRPEAAAKGEATLRWNHLFSGKETP